MKTFALLALLAVAQPAAAVRVPGGGPVRTDCYAEFEVAGVGAPAARGAVQCRDGDPACDADGVCDDSCHFQVALCANQRNLEPSCTPPGTLAALAAQGRARKLGLESPALDDSTCGAFLDVDVPVRVSKRSQTRRPGRLTLAAVAVSNDRRRRDRDHLRLECLPCGAKPAVAACPANPAGPSELRLSVAATGTDLDNGWSGISHNFPIVAASTLHFCLSGCDARGDSICEAHGATGPGSPNHATFGPPLPLLAAGVPVCVINRFRDPTLDGTANLETGGIDATVNLLSDVFLTSLGRVCPQCSGGTVGGRGVCDSGAREGSACIVEGVIEVSGNRTYHLSSACLPAGTPTGTLDLALPLTTGTSTLAGPKPCRGAADDNGCHGGGCASECTGSACVARTADGQCIDAKGGVSQLCCDRDTTLACFPTAAGDLGRIERSGVATPPASSYPSLVEETLVATFCEPATGSGTLNQVSGLPGPGALVMPVTACWGAAEAGCE
jgi:hypothetical protein